MGVTLYPALTLHVIHIVGLEGLVCSMTCIFLSSPSDCFFYSFDKMVPSLMWIQCLNAYRFSSLLKICSKIQQHKPAKQETSWFISVMSLDYSKPVWFNSHVEYQISTDIHIYDTLLKILEYSIAPGSIWHLFCDSFRYKSQIKPKIILILKYMAWSCSIFQTIFQW